MSRLFERLRSFNWRQFLVYHGRWQASTFVMMLPMYLLIFYLPLNGVSALPFVQFIGANIFYPIDKTIFTSDRLTKGG